MSQIIEKFQRGSQITYSNPLSIAHIVKYNFMVLIDFFQGLKQINDF